MIKHILLYCFSLFLLTSVCQDGSIVIPGQGTAVPGPVLEIPGHILAIHEKALVVDTHVDTPLNFMDEDFSLGDNHDTVNLWSKVDIPRMEAGGLDAVFFAAFIGQGERSREANLKSKEHVLEIFDSIIAEVGRYPGKLAIATTPAHAYELKKQGKRAIFIGMENGYPIGQDLGLVETYYNLGARYITLCHTKNNDICDSSTDPDGSEYNGLSDFGEEVVGEMNRLGMMIDISHVSDSAFYDVLKLSKVPVIASHSCARAVHDSPRNLDDEMIKTLAGKGGVVQVCLVSSYLAALEPNQQRDSALQALRSRYKDYEGLSEEVKRQARREWRMLNMNYPRPLATVADIVDHIDHIVDIAGIDYAGIGSDFDGGGAVMGCYDVSELPNITAELYTRGYTEEEIIKIWGGNIMRVMGEIESYRAR